MESNEELNSTASTLDIVYKEAHYADITNIIEFSPEKVSFLFDYISKKIEILYNTGRGRKRTVSAKNALFMYLTLVKHGDQ